MMVQTVRVKSVKLQFLGTKMIFTDSCQNVFIVHVICIQLCSLINIPLRYSEIN